MVDRKRTMRSAAELTDLTRQMTAALVEREERRSGSRMFGYEAVAGMVGRSSSWVRKFVRRDPDAKPDFIVGLNIVQLYTATCERHESDNDMRRLRIAALQDEINAALARAAGATAPDVDGMEAAKAAEQDTP